MRSRAAVLVVALTVAALASAVAPGGCDAETKYHCAEVVADPDRDSGRTLVLDGLRHSYVDTAHPTVLQYDYVRALAAVVGCQSDSEALRLEGGASDVRHVADAGCRVLQSDIGDGEGELGECDGLVRWSSSGLR